MTIYVTEEGNMWIQKCSYQKLLSYGDLHTSFSNYLWWRMVFSPNCYKHIFVKYGTIFQQCQIALRLPQRLLGRKVMTNLDSIKMQRHYFANKGLYKAVVFPVVMYGCESWTIKKAEHQRKELMLLNCGVGDSWESLGLQGDPTNPF